MTLAKRIEAIARKLEDPDDIGSSDPAENDDGECIQVSSGGWWWWYDGANPDGDVRLTGDTVGWFIEQLWRAGVFLDLSRGEGGTFMVHAPGHPACVEDKRPFFAVVEAAERALGLAGEVAP